MKKAVFFDIDGTIWDRYMKIPESTKEAIKKLKENGVYTFICSGRAPAFLKNPKLLELGFDGVLAGCGTYVSFRGEELFYKRLDQELIKKTLEILDRYHMPVVLEGKEYQYIDENDLADDPYLPVLKQELGDKLLDVRAHEMNWEANKFSATIKNDDYVYAIKELEQWYDMITHGKIVTEGVPKGHNKATAIQLICEKLDIPHEGTYAFGDSINDKEMLEYAKYGIAMGNGTEEAKEVADYVTDRLENDGIYNACKHFRLI